MTRVTTAAIAAAIEGPPVAGQRPTQTRTALGAGRMRRMSAARLLVTLAAQILQPWPSLPTAGEDSDTASTDAEVVHELRIAIRRLRALIDVFSPWLKPRWHHRLNGELRWLGQSMGPTRDTDVLATTTLPALRADFPDIDWPAVERHVEHLRRDARAQVAAALTGERQQALHGLLLSAFGMREDGRCKIRSAKALRRPSRTPGKRSRALAKHARNMLRAQYIALFPDCRQLAMLDTEQLHALRVKIKKARYSAELLAPWLRKSVCSPYESTLHAAQTLLGQLNDAVVAQRMCEAMPLRDEQRSAMIRRLDTIIVNTTSRAAHVLGELPDAHTLERGMRAR